MPKPPQAFDKQTALLIIDMQKAIDAPIWSGKNNPSLLPNLAMILNQWRKLGWPIYHIAHDSPHPESPYRPGQPGNEFKPELEPRAGEQIIRKRTNSAFLSTDLEAKLRAAGHQTLVIGGVVTNNSVEATARTAGDLGFNIYVLADGTATVGKTDRRGRRWDAEDVHDLALANLEGEYATIIAVQELLGKLPESPAPSGA